MSEPPAKRAVAFVDGQNLFHAAREAFGYTYPNYDVAALAKRVCAQQGWTLAQVRFYTGIPEVGDDPRWHSFWTHKLAAMGRGGVVVSAGLSDTATAGWICPTARNIHFGPAKRRGSTCGLRPM